MSIALKALTVCPGRCCFVLCASSRSGWKGAATISSQKAKSTKNQKGAGRHFRHKVCTPGAIYCALGLLILASHSVLAVQLNVRHYDTRDGLPQVQVLTVHQCADAYLWLGTYSGLSRYNGERFEHFRTIDGLRSNYITSLSSVGSGGLWIGTGTGVCRYVGGNIDCLDQPLLNTSHVHAIATQGAVLWAATDNGLFRIVDDVAKLLAISDQENQPVMFSLTVDGEGRLLVGSTGGFYRETDSGFLHHHLPAAAGSRNVMSLASDDSGVWIGTSLGLYRYDQASSTVTRVEDPAWLGELDIAHLHWHGRQLLAATATGLLQFENGKFNLLTTNNRLASNINREIFTDREGLTWLAHDLGLSKILPGPFHGYTVESGLRASFVRTVGQDPRQRVWLGTRAGAQIVERVDDSWRIDQARSITVADGLIDERIYSMAFPTAEETLLATSHGLVRWHDNAGVVEILSEEHGLPSNRIRALLIDSENRPWISTDLGTVVKRNGEIHPVDDPVLASAYAMRIREDADSRLWFATIQHGLILRHPDGQTEYWNAKDGLSDEMLWDVAPGADGSMWVGSNGDGLFQVWPDGRIQRWTTEEGLPDDFVWQVLLDRQGNVWAYTNRGLSRFDGASFVNYNESDGLLHLEGAATAAFESHDGQLWFASANGLMLYDAQSEHLNSVAPIVAIENVFINEQRVDPGTTLPWRPGTLRIQFAGLTFQEEQSTLFRYRLKGADSDWQESATNRTVAYASLGSGRYRFEVLARNPHGVWSDASASFEFKVRAAFWETWLFWGVALALTALLVSGGFRLRLRQSRARSRELEAIITQRTHALQQANQLLREASRSDQLTGLPNRRYLLDRIGHDIARSRRAYADHKTSANRDIIFMMIDLDGFKQINDCYGHDAGDKILVAQGRLIAQQLRETDDLVRWGGEEFLVVARDAEATLSPLLAERIVSAARSQRHEIDDSGTSIVSTCSIGIACFPFDPENPEALDWEQVVQVADQAVYRAKAMGRDGWVWVRPGPGASFDNPEEFVRGLRVDFQGLADSGQIEVTSSF
jgi:diguanylate cyclase (GGDEF)-like protein